MSVEDYFILDQSTVKKHEFANGQINTLAEEAEYHKLVVSNIIFEIAPFLRESEFEIFSSLRVGTPKNLGYFYPDAVIIDGDFEQQVGAPDTLLNPLVIFEVMDKKSRKNDRGYKFFYYKTIPSLKEYVLIDSESHSVEIVSMESKDVWRFEHFSGKDDFLFLSSINYSIAFDKIYDQVLISH